MNEVVGPAVVSIHRAQISFDKVPLFVRVPGNILILNRSKNKANVKGSIFGYFAPHFISRYNYLTLHLFTLISVKDQSSTKTGFSLAKKRWKIIIQPSMHTRARRAEGLAPKGFFKNDVTHFHLHPHALGLCTCVTKSLTSLPLRV